ncbi:hypothetical protein ACEE90_12845 [Corynebacterium phoceense]|uniref:hypothetical protein n=1 Tax=Corynebacterium phoceense TaxID=1686286 RepID=UPI001D411554|nr:hypothetical protein [Corynebacterium phoceense]MCQ9334616.1 hypothetical protein [Corynebacterium phoceense]MCQ9336101.1 hypothetical protein [Corynebacterium phoceense]HJG43712.1 hypothetical protein [Corynebacterium phoceense]
MRRALLWDSALGFVGFFAALALLQAILNLFQPSPALWPGLLAGVLMALEWALWRAKRKDLQ